MATVSSFSRLDGSSEGAILPRALLSAGKAQVCLVHQSRRLESVTGAFALHVGPGYMPQLVVNERDELTGGVLVPVAELRQ